MIPKIKHKISTENKSLSPYLDGYSTVTDKSSPVKIDEFKHKSLNSGDTGDKSGYVIEEKDKENNNIEYSPSNTCINCPKPTDSRIVHNHPFYYCIEHPKFQNINLEVIESHLILAKDHKKDITK